MTFPFYITETEFVRNHNDALDAAIARCGKLFHVNKLDTAHIAKITFLQEAEVCRLLRIYRARRNEESRP
jgi:hypothetical protein